MGNLFMVSRHNVINKLSGKNLLVSQQTTGNEYFGFPVLVRAFTHIGNLGAEIG